jgi:hypothetical protein
MEVREVLKEALEAVNWAEIPPELQEVAFTRAIDLLAGPALGASQRAGTASGRGLDAGGVGDEGDSSPTESDRLKKVADAIGVSRERIEMIYLEHEEELQIVVDPGLLGSNMKERSKSIGLLVAAGRQLGGWDEGATRDSVVRAEVDRLGVYDGGNYAKYMKDMNAWFNVNGSGKAATYKLKFQGREYLKTFAKPLAGE